MSFVSRIYECAIGGKAYTLKWVFEILADNLNVVYLNPTKSAIRYSPSFQTKECRNDLSGFGNLINVLLFTS